MQEAGEGGEDEQPWDHAGAVDGEALEPFLDVVALGAEDEELVAEIRDGNVERRRDDCRQRGSDIEKTRGDKGGEEREGGGVGKVAEGGVEDPDAEVAEELATGDEARFATGGGLGRGGDTGDLDVV